MQAQKGNMIFSAIVHNIVLPRCRKIRQHFAVFPNYPFEIVVTLLRGNCWQETAMNLEDDMQIDTNPIKETRLLSYQSKLLSSSRLLLKTFLPSLAASDSAREMSH
jgi:hypothetical protein